MKAVKKGGEQSQWQKAETSASCALCTTNQVNSKYFMWKRYSALRMGEDVAETAEQLLPQNKKMAKYPLMGLGLGLISGMWQSTFLSQQDKMRIAHSAVGKPLP